MNIGEALKLGADRVGDRDAILLLSHLINQPIEYIRLYGDKAFEQQDDYQKGLSRIETGEPLQYIMGNWDFMGQTFEVDGRVLIPRQETELLVEEALAFIQTCNQPVKLLDLCTGSGCIAISIATIAKDVGIKIDITAVDISPDALNLARKNDRTKSVNFIESDLFTNIPPTEFDIIISNPPYIPTLEIQTLSPTVRDHEPHLALDGGADGMDIYRKIVPQSINYLRNGGALYLELGSKEVKKILESSNFENINLLNDYAGLPRILYGVKSNV